MNDRERYLRLLDAVLVAKSLTDPDKVQDADGAWNELAGAVHAVRDSLPVEQWMRDGVEAENLRTPDTKEDEL